jgi:glycosyltransferase involved in cell wall biosynthesis
VNGLLAGKRIGLLAASASRLGGGVTQALVAQAEMIRMAGGEAIVMALADRYGEEDRSLFAPSEVCLSRVVGPGQFGFSPGLLPLLLNSRLDCVHQQGIWMYPSHAGAQWSRQTGRPLFISPQGMLDPWIVARGKWKKALARVGYERRAWQCAAALHALSPHEADSICRETRRHDSVVLPNVAPAAGATPTSPRPLNFVFIGRIHPKKNVLSLVEAWKLLDPAEPARLTIAGWGEPGDVNDLQASIAQAPPSVRFVGPAYGEEKQRLLETARFTILPSHSEGQPLSILESWAAATPSLMTGECNLSEGFAANAALECGYDVAAIARSISSALAQSDEQWLAMANAARDLALGHFSLETNAVRWAKVYNAAIDRHRTGKVGAEVPGH